MPITNKAKYSPDANGKLSDLLTLGKWKQGINNRIDEYSIANDSLVDALNVEIRNDGAVRRRDGYAQILDGFCHSIYSFNNKLYFVRNGDFMSLTMPDGIEEILITSFTTKKVYYVELLGELYFCSNNLTRKINKFGNVEDWGIESPKVQCLVTVGLANSGTFKKGTYRVNYSYLYGNYETSIYPLDTVIEVPYDNFNLSLSCVASQQSTSANFYLSSVNGEELYFVKSGYNVTVDNFDILSKIPKLNSDAFPYLENICYSNGRIYGTIGSKIYFSNDRDYRQYNPIMYISVDNSNIVLFKAIDDGFYVVTEKATYFISMKNPEDKENAVLNKIFNFSAIKGTLFEDENRKVGWLSTQGYIVGDQNGKLENLSEGKLDFSKNYKDGTSLLRKRDGIYQVIFSLNQSFEKTDLQTNDINNDV